MTSTKLNLALVGGFVLAGVLSLVLVLVLLAGRSGKTDSYYTVYANVAGLKFGSQVLFEGYPVGQVENIEPIQEATRTRFRVDLSITAGWKIPVDSIARPVSPGVLAPQTISIVAGKSTQTLAPGAMIKPAGGVDLLSSISSAAGNFDELTDTGLLPLLENLNKQVSTLGEILEKDLRPMARDLNVIVKATAEHWPNIVRQTDHATADLARASQRIDQFASPQRIASVDHMIDNIARTAESLRMATDKVDGLVRHGGDDLLVGLEDFRYVMDTLARHAEPAGHNADLTMRNLREFSNELRQNPGVLLRGRNDSTDATAPPLRPVEEPR